MSADTAGIEESRLDSGALLWQINRPARRNAVDPAILNWITRRCPELNRDVVVLTGEGGEAFCAGFDLRALHGPDAGEFPDESLVAATAAMDQAQALFIAALEGYAIGAGVELACACDLRIACPDSSFALPAGRLGVVYHPEGLARMHAVLGPGLTRRLVLMGETLDAEELAFSGVFDACVDDVEVLDRALADALRIRAFDRQSLMAHRRMLRDLAAGRPTAGAESYAQERRRAFERLRSRPISS